MSEFKVKNISISKHERPLIIPEIGINHEGDFSKAVRMVEDAHKAGAVVVKFQGHIIEDEMIPMAKNVIPGNAKESIWDIMKRCVLTERETIDIKNYAEELGMVFFSTPFSRAAALQLERIGVELYKIGSGECNNYPLINLIADFGKPIILSTGMNNIASIEKAVNIFERKNVPYALLHCTSMYPTPYDKVRLGAMVELKNHFPSALVGLSDHSLGNYTCFGAVALGASILEKHFTSDKNWPGPDVPISIDPQELRDLIRGSEAIFDALGGHKEILPEEQVTIDFAYACVVSTQAIAAGDFFTEQNIWVKRPGTGPIKAEQYGKLLGKRAKKEILTDTQIGWDDFE